MQTATSPATDTLGLPYVTVERALDRPDHARWVAADIAAAGRDGAGLPAVDAAMMHELAEADSVFTASDRYAVSIARELTDAGRRVGEDVLLACGVDSRYARHDGIPITALDLHPPALGATAVELLLSGENVPRVLAPELHVRGSSSGRLPSASRH